MNKIIDLIKEYAKDKIIKKQQYKSMYIDIDNAIKYKTFIWTKHCSYQHLINAIIMLTRMKNISVEDINVDHIYMLVSIYSIINNDFLYIQNFTEEMLQENMSQYFVAPVQLIDENDISLIIYLNDFIKNIHNINYKINLGEINYKQDHWFDLTDDYNNDTITLARLTCYLYNNLKTDNDIKIALKDS